MKKFFLIVVIITTFFMGCKDDIKEEKETVVDEKSSAGSRNDSISSGRAKDFMKELKKVKLDKDSMAYTEFDVADLQKIFCDSSGGNITRVRFYLGGMDTLIGGKPRKIPIVMMQVQEGGTNANPDYVYRYYRGAPVVCPPPEPCLLEQR